MTTRFCSSFHTIWVTTMYTTFIYFLNDNHVYCVLCLFNSTQSYKLRLEQWRYRLFIAREFELLFYYWLRSLISYRIHLEFRQTLKLEWNVLIDAMNVGKNRASMFHSGVWRKSVEPDWLLPFHCSTEMVSTKPRYYEYAFFFPYTI